MPILDIRPERSRKQAPMSAWLVNRLGVHLGTHKAPSGERAFSEGYASEAASTMLR